MLTAPLAILPNRKTDAYLFTLQIFSLISCALKGGGGRDKLALLVFNSDPGQVS